MTQSASNDRSSFVSFAIAAFGATVLFCISGCAAGHSFAGFGGQSAECACAECALQPVGIEGQYAEAGASSEDDYRHNYPYPETTQQPPMPWPPQQMAAAQHGHQPPAPAPPEGPGMGMHTQNVPQPMQVPTHDEKARTECEELKQQTAAMQAQLTQLQQRIAEDEQTRRSLDQSLANVNGKVSALSSELNYWKQEVQRIDADAEAQHREDMATLESISEIISQLPQPTTAAAPQRRRY
jgi:hypothetical protein